MPDVICAHPERKRIALFRAHGDFGGPLVRPASVHDHRHGRLPRDGNDPDLVGRNAVRIVAAVHDEHAGFPDPPRFVRRRSAFVGRQDAIRRYPGVFRQDLYRALHGLRGHADQMFVRRLRHKPLDEVAQELPTDLVPRTQRQRTDVDLSYALEKSRTLDLLLRPRPRAKSFSASLADTRVI